MDADALLAAVKKRLPGDSTDPQIQDARWADVAARSVERGAPFEQQWRLYQNVFSGRPPTAGPPVVWRPRSHARDRPNADRMRSDLSFKNVQQLHAFSLHAADFWEEMIRRLAIPFDIPPTAILQEPVDPQDPVWLPGARMNIAEACFQAEPDQVAIVEATEGTDTLRTVTYGELQDLAQRFGNGLRAQGLGEGDGVALYMPMTVECVAAYLGTILVGCHVVSIPDSFAAPEIATRLRLGSARAAVTMDAFRRGGKTVPLYSKLAAARTDMDVRCIVIGEARLEEGDLRWDDLLPDAHLLDAHQGAPDRVCNVLFSSGTTGEPKAIPWTHLTPIKCASDGHLHQDIHAEDVVAWPTNIGWMMGPWLIFATFVNRATMFLYQGLPSTQHFVRSVDAAGVTVLGVVPAIVRAWLQAGIPSGSLPQVRVLSSTGEASNPHDYLYLMSLAAYQAPVIEYCGGTEIGGGHLTGTLLHPASPATFTSPAFGLSFVVLRDDGDEAEPGEMGEIFLVPPSIGLSQRLLNKDHFKEYYADVPVGPHGHPLRRHGDEVQVLHGGFWAAQGRADDTMNLGGIKVGSIELETAMNGHDAVVETAAVAVRPAGGGADRLVVFAVLEGPAEDLKGALQERLKQRLNPLFRIHDVVVVDRLPRTASNKVMRRELRREYLEALAA